MVDVLAKTRRSLVNPAATSAEAFRGLMLALQLHTQADGGNALLFTSAEAGAGKSTVAANYALVASLRHGSVLLVDADLRRPTLHEIFGVPRSPGIVDLLAAKSTLTRIVQRVSAVGELGVLTAGRPIPGAADLVSSPRMAELIREAVAKHELVIIDSPPLLAAADAEGLAAQPGVGVVLVAHPTTKRRALMQAVRRLKLIDARLVGVVLNQAGRATQYGY